MIEVILPFDRVATMRLGRQPRVLINTDVMDWILERKIRYNWLIGRQDRQEEWKVSFEFPESAQAIVFKLTFGGA